MRLLHDIPEIICNPEEESHVIYCDTDSLYVHAEALLNFLNPNFEELSEKEKIDFLEKIAIKYQHLITKNYNQLAKSLFNTPSHRFEMKTEAVIRSAYFRASRRYAQWIVKLEGQEENNLDIKGLEFKKSNFPPLFGEFFKDILIKVLKGSSKKEIDKIIQDFKVQIISGDVSFLELGNPTAVKTLNKYIHKKPLKGEIFSTVHKGAPAPVKAAIIHNDLLKFWGLDKTYSYISQGDKIKWVYLEENPFRIEAIGFLGFDLAPQIKDFILQYLDKGKTFDSILLNKLENFYLDLGWSLDLNPFKKEFFVFD